MSNDDKTLIAELNHTELRRQTQKKSTACLVQYNGNALGKRYTLLDNDVKIGRSPDADITIGEASVSRIHARIIQRENLITIEDTGSANGTYINDQKINSETPLNDRDMLRLGAVILKFFSSDNMDGYVQDQIYRKATIDVGTQVYNKLYLLESLAAEFNQSKQSGRLLSLIYYDLDHFKKVNDNFGHNAGDQVLKESTQIVKNMIRKDDILGRFGGEEFIIVLPNTDLNTAYELGERTRQACENYLFQLDVIDSDGTRKKVPHRQTFSVGITQLDSSMNSPKDLLESADKKLYKSKQTGRNKVTI